MLVSIALAILMQNLAVVMIFLGSEPKVVRTDMGEQVIHPGWVSLTARGSSSSSSGPS